MKILSPRPEKDGGTHRILLKTEGVSCDKVTPQEVLQRKEEVSHCSAGDSRAPELAVLGQLDPPAWSCSSSEVSLLGRGEKGTLVYGLEEQFIILAITPGLHQPPAELPDTAPPNFLGPAVPLPLFKRPPTREAN